MKGQAAIITEENYELELAEAKKKRKKALPNIKKEKILANITNKPQIISNVPFNSISIPAGQQSLYAPYSLQPVNNLSLQQNITQHQKAEDNATFTQEYLLNVLKDGHAESIELLSLLPNNIEYIYA